MRRTDPREIVHGVALGEARVDFEGAAPRPVPPIAALVVRTSVPPPVPPMPCGRCPTGPSSAARVGGTQEGRRWHGGSKVEVGAVDVRSRVQRVAPRALPSRVPTALMRAGGKAASPTSRGGVEVVPHVSGNGGCREVGRVRPDITDEVTAKDSTVSVSGRAASVVVFPMSASGPCRPSTRQTGGGTRHRGRGGVRPVPRRGGPSEKSARFLPRLRSLAPGGCAAWAVSPWVVIVVRGNRRRRGSGRPTSGHASSTWTGRERTRPQPARGVRSSGMRRSPPPPPCRCRNHWVRSGRRGAGRSVGVGVGLVVVFAVAGGQHGLPASFCELEDFFLAVARFFESSRPR